MNSVAMDCDSCFVAQVSKPAVSPISISAAPGFAERGAGLKPCDTPGSEDCVT